MDIEILFRNNQYGILFEYLYEKYTIYKKLSFNEFYILIVSGWEIGEEELCKFIYYDCRKQYPEFRKILEYGLLIFGNTGDFTVIESIKEEIIKYKSATEIFYIYFYNHYLLIGDYNKSKQYLFIGFKRFPNSSKINYNIGNYYYSIGEYERALLFYNVSISLDDYLYSRCKKIKILKLIGRKYLAFELNKTTLKLLYDSKNIFDFDLILGNLMYEKGNFFGAINQYKKYICLCKNDTYTLSAIGNCYKKLGLNNQAIIYYSKAIFKNKYLIYPRVEIAKILFYAGEYRKCLILSIQIYKLNSNNFENIYLIARTYYKLLDFKEAYLFFLKASNLKKNHQMLNRYLIKTFLKI